MKHTLTLLSALLFCLNCLAQTVPNHAANEVYQYFLPEPEGENLGAYLWVPPETPVIRAVMVGIHNGLPMTILQNQSVRKVCGEFGIATVIGAGPTRSPKNNRHSTIPRPNLPTGNDPAAYPSISKI
jgi:hypothetical protein